MDSRITELISSAEEHIESKQYAVALEQLSVAEQIEPNNKSIQMIRSLVQSLQLDQKKMSPMKRFFSATVDPKSPTGFSGEPANGQGSGLQKRIRSLTSSAEYFLSRGNVDNAFESLMRAYLLDPLAPEVLACEKRVLPAWHTMHGTVVGTKQEWKLPAPSVKAKASSSLFERLKGGTFLG
jgi:hypothetical protein